MKKTLKLIFVVLVIFIGCTKNDITNSPEYNYSVEYLGEFELTAFEDVEGDISFAVLVRDADSLAAEGVAVKLTLIGVEGSISPAEVVTDENGMIEAVASVKASLGESTAHIIVMAGESTHSQEIEITGIDRSLRMRFHTSTPVLKVVPDENAEFEFTVTVTDEGGNGVPNIDLIFSLHPAEPDSEIFGSIRESASTGEFGVATVIFYTLGGSGKIFLKCEVEELIGTEYALSGSFELSVELLTSGPSQLSLAINPGYLLLPKDTVGHATIYARKRDNDYNGIPNLEIDFSCQYGSITNTTLTDSTGLATADYYILPITDFPRDDQGEIVESITDNIRAVIPNTAFEAHANITVEKTAGDEGTINLTSDRAGPFYPDNGRTVVNFQAVLKDANNQALAGRELIVTATHGSIETPVYTDSMGVARITFIYEGQPPVDDEGNPVPVMITVSYPPYSLYASIEILILKYPPVISSIALQAEDDELTADSNDSTWVGAVCFMETGDFAPEGTVVHFETDRGRFIESSVPVTGHNGTAVNYFIADSVACIAHLQAYVENSNSIVYSNVVEIEILPGPPASGELSYDPEDRKITVTLYDRFDNNVGAGYLVTFSTTLGYLDRVSASTDENGQAFAYFRPGVNSGVAVITIAVNTAEGEIIGQLTIDVRAGEGNSIELHADPTNIAVRGAGANSSSTLTASLYDPNHNLVQTAHWIIFEILYEPPYNEGGCYFRNRSQIDSAQTSNGHASVTLNAGTVIGGKLLRASAYYNNRQDTISVTSSRVSVVAGAPHAIYIDYDSNGEDAGGGNWQLDVSARVFDEYMNPAGDSIWVEFSVDSIATIGSGYTRYSTVHVPLVYNSENTFDTVTVSARIQIDDDEYISAERVIVLPLQEGIMTLDVTPDSWDIDEDTVAVFTCLIELRDEQGVLINNAPIGFFASRASFYWIDQNDEYQLYDPDAHPPQVYTGRGREHRGQATVYLMGEEMDFFLDAVTPEVNVQIGAILFGYDDVIADPVIVVVTRHP
ncbi:MAG: hypothetical protein HQ568_06545 [Calditrichaeota bacterium]|nr:hypothetical protein [Calditrichota bacterium]